MSKILVLSTVDFHFEGHGWALAEKLRTQGNEVCFICLEKSQPDTEAYFFDKYSRKGIQNVFRVLYNNIDGLFLRKVMRADSLYCFQTAGLNGISARRILKKCPFIPEIIHITWTARFLIPKTVRELYERTGATIVFNMVDEAILSACHYPGDCKGYINGCKDCPGVKHFKFIPRRIVRMKEKFWTGMPAKIYGSRYDISLCRKVSFLRHMRMTGEVVVPNITPVFSKKESRLFFSISDDDYLIFMGANSLLEKRKGLELLIKAVNRLADITTGGKHISLLLIGSLNGVFPYSVDERVSFIVKDFMPKEDFFKAYYACDVYASPTLADSGPMMVNYALACGRPVVAFPVGCAMDLVIHSRTGYMAKYADSDDYCNGLLFFYNMKENDLIGFEEVCRKHIAQYKA